MTSYDVTVTREDNLWVAVVHGLSPAATDVEHFADLDLEVRDLIAGLTDVDPDEIAIRWRYEFNGRDVTEQLARFMAVESELRERMTEREAVRMEVIRRLAEAGLSQRAISDAVGISHQRVNQLINS